MKLQESNIQIQKSDADVKEMNFSIDTDSPVVFQILRKKMYSNAIRIVLQEIVSNARDANRENNKPDEPVRIFLPNSLSAHLRIQDFGIGISPDRMENIFIKFGASTKRDDNLQTGGFGLGAKTPFAYSDTFQIITITAENGKKIERTYVAYIDESEKGKMTLCSTKEVDQDTSTGTTIQVPVKPDDFRDFQSQTEHIFQYWNIKPIVAGVDNFEFDSVEKVIQGTKWYMGRFKDGREAYHNGIIITVDNIPYSFSWDEIDNEIEKMFKHEKQRETYNEFYKICHLGQYEKDKVIMDFKTGEIALTSSRETIDFCDLTIKTIIDRLKIIKKELKKSVEDSLKNCNTLVDAIAFYSNSSSKIREIIEDPEWNGKKIKLQYKLPAVSQSHITLYEKNEKSSSGKCRHGSFSISFIEGTLRVINDTSEDAIRRRIATIFETMSDVNRVEVLELPSDFMMKGIVDARVAAKNPDKDADGNLLPTNKQEEIDYLNKKIYLNDLGFVNISSFPKKKVERKYDANGTPRVSYVCSTFTNNEWTRVTSDEVDFENDSGIYVIREDRQNVKTKQNGVVTETYSDSVINIIRNHYGFTVIGIKEKQLKKLGSDWKPISSYIDERKKNIEAEIEKLITEIKDNGFVIRDDTSAMDDRFSQLYMHFEGDYIKQLDNNHLLVEYFNKTKENNAYKSKMDKILNDYYHFTDSYYEDAKLACIRGRNIFKKYETKLKNNYPVLEELLDNNYINSKKILEYIKQMDKLAEFEAKEKSEETVAA